jgi:hypothetical protein
MFRQKPTLSKENRLLSYGIINIFQNVRLPLPGKLPSEHEGAPLIS